MKDSERISAELLVQQEITRGTVLGVTASRAQAAGRPVPDEAMLAILRRWYWARQTSRGFILAGFPATVAQAIVFDQWLDARDETLTACLWCGDGQALNGITEGWGGAVADYYRARGLLLSSDDARPADTATAGLDDLAPLAAGR